MGIVAAQLGVTGIIPNTTGLGKAIAQQIPTFILLESNNTLAEVLVPGYLNPSARVFGIPYTNQQIALVYTTDAGSVWLQIAVTGTAPNYVYSLIGSTDVANVFVAAVGSVIAPSYTFAGRTDTGLYSSAPFNLDVAIEGSRIANFSHIAFQVYGNITAGQSGTSGLFKSYPVNATQGTLVLQAIGNTAGDFSVTINNANFGQSSVMVIPDPVNAAGRFLVAATNTPFTANHLVVASGTGGLMVDAGYQMKTVAGAAAAGGNAAQSFTDAFCTSASNVIGNWNTQANAASVLKIVPGNGSFVVTSTADAGVGTFNYIITK